MIKLVKTCHACPEQYDAYRDGVQVGYLRLRHGFFTVDFPDHNGEEIYSAQPNGDGCFGPEERDYYLRFAVDAIERRLGDGPTPKAEPPNVQYEIV